MSLLVIEAGLQSSLQGRKIAGHRHLGMPFAGPADPLCHGIANWLVGNPAAAAAIEATLTRSVFECREDCVMAVAGAAAGWMIDTVAAPPCSAHRVRKGQTITIPAVHSGCRTYIAVAGGFCSDDLFGSGSTFLPAGLGGYKGRALRPGDELKVAASSQTPPNRSLPAMMRPYFGNSTFLRATPGAEHAQVDQIACHTFWNTEFTISRRANRTGMALEGPRLSSGMEEIASAATFPGTVQCPPSGVPFLLGIDAQTTGGYPRIAEVIRADRHMIGQLRPGQRVRFVATDIKEAQNICRAKQKLWRGTIADITID